MLPMQETRGQELLTPEQVRASLLARGIPEDIAQDMLVDYLMLKRPGHHTPAWWFKRAQWRIADGYRDEPTFPIAEPEMLGRVTQPLQLRLAIAWQALDRYADSRTSTGKGPRPATRLGQNKKKIKRWHGCPTKPWSKLRDYLALKSAKP